MPQLKGFKTSSGREDGILRSCHDLCVFEFQASVLIISVFFFLHLFDHAVKAHSFTFSYYIDLYFLFFVFCSP